MITRLFMLVLPVVLLTGCGRGPYADLEKSFPANTQLSSTAISVDSLVVVSKSYGRPFTYQGTFAIQFSSDSVEIAPSSKRLARVTIPVRAVTVCSARGFGDGTWEAELALGQLETQLSFSGDEMMVDWCWQNRIPAASFKEMAEWQYDGVPLPSRDSDRAEFVSREAYDEQFRQARLGY